MSNGLSQQEKALERRVNELWTEVRNRDPAALTRNTGASFENGRFRLPVWGQTIEFGGTDFRPVDVMTGRECDAITQAILAYYFHTADGFPPAERWIAFSELPDGQFYSSAFQGYTGSRLVQHFANDPGEFSRASIALGGIKQLLGDAAFRFEALPRVPVAAVCWLGDEDFPPSYRILFEQTVEHYLPTDGCAILGSMLTSRLIAFSATISGHVES